MFAVCSDRFTGCVTSWFQGRPRDRPAGPPQGREGRWRACQRWVSVYQGGVQPPRDGTAALPPRQATICGRGPADVQAARAASTRTSTLGDVGQPGPQLVVRGSAPGSPTPGRRPRPAACRAPAAPAGRWPPAPGRPPPPSARTRHRPRPARRRPAATAAARRGRRSTGTGSSLLTSTLIRSPCGRSRPAHDRAGDDPHDRGPASPRAGTAPAVVITTCPAGGAASSAAGRPVSSSDSTSSSTSTGVEPVRSATSRWAASRSASARRALLALRSVGAGRQPVDRQAELVAVRADGRHATAHVGGAGLGQRRGQAGCAATAGRSSARPASARRPGRRRRRRRGAGCARRASPGRGRSAPRPRQLGVPHVERRRRGVVEPPADLAQQRVALAHDAVELQPAASYLTASATSVSSRNRRRSAGAPLTSVRSSGENTVTRTTPSRSRARPRRWRLTCTRLRPAGTSSASISDARPSSSRTSARTTAAVAPTRTSASAGAPRKLDSVAR